MPDKPCAADLFAIGHGNPGSYDEDKNGVLVLDELGTWLNARSFQDPERAPVLDWLIHARKYGWDVYYIMQGLGQVDKQIRESLCEYTVRLIRFDKLLVPVIGWVLKWMTGGLILWRVPRFHMAGVRLGIDPRGMVVDRHLFRADDVHRAYDTRQVFSPHYDSGVYSMLSAWHLKGRYVEASEGWRWLRAWWGTGRDAQAPRPRPPPKPRHPLVAAVARAYRDQPDRVVAHISRLSRSGVLDRAVG